MILPINDLVGYLLTLRDVTRARYGYFPGIAIRRLVQFFK